MEWYWALATLVGMVVFFMAMFGLVGVTLTHLTQQTSTAVAVASMLSGLIIGQGYGSAAVPENSLNSFQFTVGSGRIKRHRNPARVQTCQKSGNIGKTGRKEENNRIADTAMLL